ncbi:putative membrane transporter protein [Desulfovibrionales bacterium]
MLEILGLIFFGFVVGGYGTLVGIGGGPLIIPVLATFYRYDVPTVVATSMLVIFCNTLSGTVAYWRERRIDIVSGTKFGLASIPGALLSVLAVAHVHVNVFSFLFGFFLLILALYVFLYPVTAEYTNLAVSNWWGGIANLRRPSRTRLAWGSEFLGPSTSSSSQFVTRRIEDCSGHCFSYQVNESLGIWLAVGIGAFSTFLGIGGGLIMVPVLIYMLSFPVHVAMATSHYITAINAGFTLIPLLSQGAIPWNIALYIAGGAIFGAQIGAKLSGRLCGKRLLQLLTPVFLLAAIKLMFFNF